MITLHDLISATPMYRSLTPATQARYMRRAGKRIHRHFQRAGVIDDVVDGDVTDDFATQFVVTPDNAKTVVRLICTVWSFSWLGMIFNVLWAAHKRSAAVLVMQYVLVLAFVGSLFISMEAHVMVWDVTMPHAQIAISVLAAILGRSLAIYGEAADILVEKYGIEVRPIQDRLAQSLLGPGNPWLRILLCVAIVVGFGIAELTIGEAFYGDSFVQFDPWKPGT